MITMVISGRSTSRFADANYAVLRKKCVDGSWRSASTNEQWELFWCEIEEYHGDTLVLEKLDETHMIEEDDRGEFIEVIQENRSLLARDEYPTRFRPYIEASTGSKPWMGEEDG